MGAPEVARGSPAPGLLLGPQQGVDPLAGAQRVAHKVFVSAVDHNAGACKGVRHSTVPRRLPRAGMPQQARQGRGLPLMPVLDQPSGVGTSSHANLCRARGRRRPSREVPTARGCFVLDACLTATEHATQTLAPTRVQQGGHQVVVALGHIVPEAPVRRVGAGLVDQVGGGTQLRPATA